MKIYQLLQLDSLKRQNRSNRSILGDSYLLAHNRVYRNIRNSLHKNKIILQEAWPAYLINPLFELEKIIEEKKVPYLPWGKILRRIESEFPRRFSYDELPIENSTSYHIHESAHVLSDLLFGGAKFETKNGAILKTMFCEAIALTTEAMMNDLARNEVHQQFIKHTSYIETGEKLRKASLAVDGIMTTSEKFEFIFYANLYANYLFLSVDDKILLEIVRRINPLLKPQKSQLRKLSKLFNMFCSGLDIKFRSVATSYYLKRLGMKKNIVRTLDFDFIREFDRRPIWKENLNQYKLMLLKNTED